MLTINCVKCHLSHLCAVRKIGWVRKGCDFWQRRAKICANVTLTFASIIVPFTVCTYNELNFYISNQQGFVGR